MSFNYGREEKKWRLWKEAEEKKLRSLGVSKDTIEKLRTHDWAVLEFTQGIKTGITYKIIENRRIKFICKNVFKIYRIIFLFFVFIV